MGYAQLYMDGTTKTKRNWDAHHRPDLLSIDDLAVAFPIGNPLCKENPTREIGSGPCCPMIDDLSF